MPVKLRNPKARQHRITPEAVEAYRSGDWLALHRALGLKPWDTSPLDVDSGPPPGGYDADAWAAAQALRRELKERQP